MEIEEIQFLSGFDSGAVTTFHSMPLYCTPHSTFSVAILNARKHYTQTLFFCSNIFHFALRSANSRFGWIVSNDFICNRNDTCYSEKNVTSQKKQNKAGKKAEAFMKSTLIDVNKIKSLWIHFFFVFTWENALASERVHLVVKLKPALHSFLWCVAKWFCLLNVFSLFFLCRLTIMLWFDLLKWPMNCMTGA